VERRVLDLPLGEPLPLDQDTLHSLLADPAYTESLGEPAHALHLRRRLPDGSGLHLVILPDGASLHRDRTDPRNGPAALMAHLAADAPRESLALLAAGWAALRRLGR